MRRFVYYNAASAGASLLLDLYPAAAAYSLRKLRTAYSGACIRVRRSSDNAESDIGFNAGVLDTAALLSFVGAGNGFVVTWYDQQGAFNVTQTSSTAQPQIVSSGSLITRSSLPAVKFDGSNDTLFRAGTILNQINISNFSVSNNDVSNNNGTTFCSSIITTSSLRVFCDRRTTLKRNLFITTAGGDFAADMSAFRNTVDIRLLSSFVDASKNMSSFDDGATGGTDNFGSSFASDGLRLGAQAFGVTFLNGTIQELILYNTNESANRTAIETDINTYYAIY
jgi:hypothetical protein